MWLLLWNQQELVCLRASSIQLLNIRNSSPCQILYSKSSSRMHIKMTVCSEYTTRLCEISNAPGLIVSITNCSGITLQLHTLFLYPDMWFRVARSIIPIDKPGPRSQISDRYKPDHMSTRSFFQQVYNHYPLWNITEQ